MLALLKAALVSTAKPETKAVACELVKGFADKSESTSLEIEWLVHPLSILMNDIKAPVKAATKLQ